MNHEAQIDKLEMIYHLFESEVKKMNEDLKYARIHVDYDTSFGRIEYDAFITQVYTDYGCINFKIVRDDGSMWTVDRTMFTFIEV